MDTIEISSEAFSRRISRPQFLRRSLGNSQHTSPGSKKGAMRINKPNTTSNSPHNIQRRRTTASHAVRSNNVVSQTSTLQGRSSIGGSLWSQRPMSWHPGSQVQQEPIAVQVPTDYTLGNTIAGLETLAVSRPVSSAYEDSTNVGHLPTGSCDRSSYQAMENYTGWDNLSVDPSLQYPSYPSHDLLNTNQYYIPPQNDFAYGNAAFTMSGFDHTTPVNVDYQTQASVEMLPTHYPRITDYGNGLSCPPQVVTKKSKELVGMGLYDDKNGSMVSTSPLSPEGHTPSSDMHRNSMGKGLKLEETWQPPGEELAEEGEDYSSDEAEDDLLVAPSTQQPQVQDFSNYEDLSNQSFFFESDDQYTNYMAFNQSMQYCDPKAPDPSSGNFLWF